MLTGTQSKLESCSKDGEKAVRMVYVGLDVHKLSISLGARCDSMWVFERTFATTDLTELRKALKELQQLFGQVLIFRLTETGKVAWVRPFTKRLKILSQRLQVQPQAGAHGCKVVGNCSPLSDLRVLTESASESAEPALAGPSLMH